MKPIIDKVNGTVVECNTAYEGQRNTTQAHWHTMEKHGWSKLFTVDILDEEGDLNFRWKAAASFRKTTSAII